jgi:hypothetical protein
MHIRNVVKRKILIILKKQNLEDIKNRKFVVADPNTSDLIYYDSKDENNNLIK